MAKAYSKEFSECAFCEITLAESELYQCIVDACPKYGILYCQDCGTLSHRRLNHQFHITAEYIKKYNPSLVEQSVKKGMQKAKGALGACKENEMERIRHNVESLYISCNSTVVNTHFNNIFSQNTVFKCGDLVQQLFKEALDPKTLTKGSQLIGAMTDTAVEVSKFAAEGAAIAAGAMAMVEIIYHSYRFWRGDIETWAEYGRYVSKGITSAVGMGLGNWSGTSVGAAVGAIGGPMGMLIGGIIGGIVGGLAGTNIAKKAFDYVWADIGVKKEQAKRATLIKEALLLFGYLDVSDIENPDIFNKEELQKRYRAKAKIYHPDRNKNTPQSYTNFHTLNASLGCLLALVEQKNKTKTVKSINKIQRAIAWQ